MTAPLLGVVARAEAEEYRRFFRPAPRMSIVEWADAYRYLASESSAEPGKYLSSRAPYQREPMEVMSDPSVGTVVFMWASQMGKSLLFENAIAYTIDSRPRPMLMVQPTVEFAEQFSKERFVPMVRVTPKLHGLISEAKSRDSNNTIRYKMFPGGFLAFVGSNAPAGLAGRPIGTVFADEIDRYDDSAGTEGDAIELAERRMANFADGQIFKASTPVLKDTSRIVPAYEGGDQRRYYVPCPFCGERQVLLWGKKGLPYGLRWEPDRPQTAAYQCASCGKLIEEKYKSWMLATENGAEWRREAPANPYPSFFINGLYSPFGRSTWAHHAAKFLEVRGDPPKLQSFVNTVLCEPWEEQGERIEPNALLSRLEDLGTGAPLGSAVITAAIDVQSDRLEYRVWAWGRGEESWLLRVEQILGDPGTAAPWEAVTLLRRETFKHPGGSSLRISCTMVDTGFHTAAAYAYCRRFASENVCAAKGVEGDGIHLLGKPSRQSNAKVIVYPIGTHAAKELFLLSQIRVEVGKPGSVHLPDWITVAELEQLTSEKRVSRPFRGRYKRAWVVVPGRRENHGLDCRVLCMAGLHRLGPNVVRNLGAAVDALAPKSAEENAEIVEIDPRSDEEKFRGTIRRPRIGFVDDWRY